MCAEYGWKAIFSCLFVSPNETAMIRNLFATFYWNWIEKNKRTDLLFSDSHLDAVFGAFKIVFPIKATLSLPGAINRTTGLDTVHPSPPFDLVMMCCPVNISAPIRHRVLKAQFTVNNTIAELINAWLITR